MEILITCVPDDALTLCKEKLNDIYVDYDILGIIILVPRAYDSSGLRQESRALGASILK